MATRGGERGRGRGRGRGDAPRGGPPARGSAPRGGPPSRGGPPPRAPAVASHVESIGVKRPSHGNSGRALEVYTNHFASEIPQSVIHHYDGTFVILPSEKTLPAALNFDIIKALQTEVAPNVFTPRGAYDGRKNLFAGSKFSFGDAAEFDVTLSPQTAKDPPLGGRGPKVYKVRLSHVAEINPEVLSRFLLGQQSHDNSVLTAITALNVVVRMEPNLKYPFNVRSFFTPKGAKAIGGGIELWRGYFQSVRPAIGQMLINVDISTGAMYKPGPLIGLCLEFLGIDGKPQLLAPRNQLPDRERMRLQRFITGLKITTSHGGAGRGAGRPRVVKKLSREGARDLSFELGNGQKQSVADYFRGILNAPLRFPDVICVELGSGALIPLELCEVTPGQIIRRQIPPEKTSAVLEFATKKPQDRLASIKEGLGVLAYGQSEYVRQFGMRVDNAPLKINARVLQAPTLKYGVGSRQANITPRDGAWNMMEKRMFNPSRIDSWVVVIFERRQRFDDQRCQNMINGLMEACTAVGIIMNNAPMHVSWQSGQGNIQQHLINAGNECRKKTANAQNPNGTPPSLIVVILPEGGNDIYTAVKHFGDVVAGIPTQCMKSSKCFNAKQQYYANVTLKLNVKLGGINTIPEPRSVAILTDPNNPTIVMGADVIHPAPGSDGRPSFTALVGSVDSDSAKYVAKMEVQTSRQEIIEALEPMSQYILDMYMKYRRHVEKKANPAPKRIIFYRDGVSEGQFQQVLDKELTLLQNACKNLNINPKITMIVVGKRHHVRFFPKSANEGDRSGNCPAGTVVDTDVVNPVEFDFYLQSHGGLLGTSRPAHYNVLYDENGFTPDGLQSLSFALCHVYARSTRSVSIPAPVYYADIVCSRAKHHYDPQNGLDLSMSETATNTTEQAATLEKFKKAFQPLHRMMQSKMYFC
ncbi:argonaute-like protein [Artomyces pyxidatus]|uniref:Argonaute-like protein n=1 Tax=Artomyces pyxidatus TaxID=48021 RepID=A0ACB8TJT8_9AGAM|nr:argonaute-like protein [Artomyces pyxidatus]